MPATETELERLVVRLVGDVRPYLDSLAKSAKATEEAAARVQAQADKIEQSAKGGFGAAAGAASSSAASQVGSITTMIGQLELYGVALVTAGQKAMNFFGGAATSAVMAAGKFEQTQIAFTTLLGSADEADRTLASLTKFAADTPFEMPEIEAAARQMIAFGERGDKLEESLKLVGNAAAATGANFRDVGLIFNQVRGNGKLMWEDFQQLTQRGVLSLQDLADHYKVTTVEARKMMADGKITFDDMRQVFTNLSKEGGRFAGALEKQSKSMLGQFSTLRDNVGMFSREVGQVLAPVVKTATEFLMRMTNTLRNMPDGVKIALAVILGLGVAFGALAVAMGATILVYKTLIVQTMAFVTASRLATAAVLAGKAALVGGVAFAYYQLGLNLTGAASAYKEFNRETERAADLQAALLGRIKGRGDAEVKAAKEISDPGKRKDFLEEAAAKLKKEVEGAEKTLTNAQKNLLDEMTFKNFVVDGKTLELARRQRDEAKAALDQWRAAAKAVEDELKGVASPETNQALVGGINALVNKLKEERDTIGMTAHQVELYKLKMQGATDAMLRGARAQADLNLRLMEFKKLNDDIKGTVEHLQDQIEALGLTGEEARLAKLQDRIIELREAAIKAGTPPAEAKKQFQPLLDGINKARFALDDLETKRESRKLHEQFLSMAEKLKDELKTPLDRFNEEVANLEEMLGRGFIDQTVFDKGMDLAKKKFEELTRVAKESARAVERFDSVLRRSAEGEFRVRNQLETLFGGRGNAFPRAPAAPEPRPVPPPAPAPITPDQMKIIDLLMKINLGIATMNRRADGAPFAPAGF